MVYDVIIKGDGISHADFPFKGQKNVKSEKIILELQVSFSFNAIPTAAHTLDHVKETIEAFEAIKEKLQSGHYAQVDLVEFS